MTHIISASASSSKSIAVQTRLGSSIQNFQYGHTLSTYEKKQLDDLRVRYQLANFFKIQFSTAYNCHGLTFASRRTSIHEASEINKILKEDEYLKIDPSDVLPGDVIVYTADNGDIEHSGVVVSRPEPPLNIPMVVSKWGYGSEVVHAANNCPYVFSVKYFRVSK